MEKVRPHRHLGPLGGFHHVAVAARTSVHSVLPLWLKLSDPSTRSRREEGRCNGLLLAVAASSRWLDGIIFITGIMSRNPGSPRSANFRHLDTLYATPSDYYMCQQQEQRPVKGGVNSLRKQEENGLIDLGRPWFKWDFFSG